MVLLSVAVLLSIAELYFIISVLEFDNLPFPNEVTLLATPLMLIKSVLTGGYAYSESS